MMSGRRAPVFFAVLLACMAALTGCSGSSKKDFAELYAQAVTIKHGQPEAEVVALLGEPKERKSGSFGDGTLLVYPGESPEDNHIMIVITDGKVTSGMATKKGEVTTFGRDASHSEPAKGTRPQSP